MNNYEAPVVVQMGLAHDLILGPKPNDLIQDSEGTQFKRDAEVDIDEEE